MRRRATGAAAAASLTILIHALFPLVLLFLHHLSPSATAFAAATAAISTGGATARRSARRIGNGELICVQLAHPSDDDDSSTPAGFPEAPAVRLEVLRHAGRRRFDSSPRTGSAVAGISNEEEKKERHLTNFYRENFSARTRGQVPPRPKDGDVTYYYCHCSADDYDEEGATILAALRISAPKKQRPPYAFLRAVCVASNVRRRGLATKLLRESLSRHFDQEKTNGGDKGDGTALGCYCLADRTLRSLYEGAGFVVASDNPRDADVGTIGRKKKKGEAAAWMWQKFRSVAGRAARRGANLDLLVWNTRQLGAMEEEEEAKMWGRGADEDDGATTTMTTTRLFRSVGRPPPLRVVLLRHSREVGRLTATAPLLREDWCCSSNKGDEGGVDNSSQSQKSLDLSQHLAVEEWTWSGRADNSKVERRLNRIKALDGGERGGSPVLLWATAVGATDEKDRSADGAAAISMSRYRRTYIVLDGTWQEARSMFRKMPFLRSLPRLSLEPAEGSAYDLRGDYTGWRERFGGRGEKNHRLLCTAEVVAALVDLHGDCETADAVGDAIRARLDAFQREYKGSSNFK